MSLVKAWAFSRFASIDVRWKNSYAWTLMVISFLQVCASRSLPSATPQHYVLFQSGVSPPILPCIHAELSHDLVAALVENPHSEELTVTIAIIIPLLLSSYRTVPTLFFAGRCCARTGGFDEQAWPK